MVIQRTGIPLVVWIAVIVAGSAFVRVFAGVTFGDTDSPTLLYISEYSPGAQGESEVMSLLSDPQKPGALLDGKAALLAPTADAKALSAGLLDETAVAAVDPTAANAGLAFTPAAEGAGSFDTVLKYIIYSVVLLSALGVVMIIVAARKRH
ncbi:MAG: hypothetical protein IH624_03290 [Phycisphaerae bacterium]|nr:hypothetical protein [Phycisphaerae bacterium]